MDKFKKRYGDWALVAGAAEGLGAAFSEILASWGLHVIMVDRDAGKMKVTAERLRGRYSVSIREMEADLSDMLNVAAIHDQMMELNCHGSTKLRLKIFFIMKNSSGLVGSKLKRFIICLVF